MYKQDISIEIWVAPTREDPHHLRGVFEHLDEAVDFAQAFLEEGLDVEFRRSTSNPICDFCSSSNVHWRYPAKDFIPDSSIPWGSRGDWAACNGCHDFIEENDREGLLERSIKSFPLERLELNLSDEIMEALRNLHNNFFNMRIGLAKKEENHG